MGAGKGKQKRIQKTVISQKTKIDRIAWDEFVRDTGIVHRKIWEHYLGKGSSSRDYLLHKQKIVIQSFLLDAIGAEAITLPQGLLPKDIQVSVDVAPAPYNWQDSLVRIETTKKGRISSGGQAVGHVAGYLEPPVKMSQLSPLFEFLSPALQRLHA